MKIYKKYKEKPFSGLPNSWAKRMKLEKMNHCDQNKPTFIEFINTNFLLYLRAANTFLSAEQNLKQALNKML